MRNGATASPLDWRQQVLLFPLSQEETIPVVEEIVPESERGEKLGGLFGTDDKVSKFSGHSVTTPYVYEKITASFVGTTDKGGADMVAVVTWQDHSCE